MTGADAPLQETRERRQVAAERVRVRQELRTSGDAG